MSEKSDQPSEEPTARRWEKAYEEGQIAFSTELISGLAVLVAMLFFWGAGRWFFDGMVNALRERLTFFDPMISSPESIFLAINRGVKQTGIACLGLMFPLAMIAIVCGTLQTRFNISFKPLELKWSKVSIISGFKRIFSTRSLNRGLIAIAKASAIVFAAYWLTVNQIDDITYAGMQNFELMLKTGGDLLLTIGFMAALLMVVIGVVDLAFQIWKQNKDLMMTKQEVKDESKDSDGDPQVKARIRRLQNELSQKRVVQEVPKATVVITNPTHFAVALKYDPTAMAPIVVAKGADHLAKQIIRVAKENGVPVVERKPVARFLYANVKAGQEIPFELYKVVAEILNFINKVDNAA
ncbi:MAG: flagellar biosynthesis protein FlhB [Mariniblastus sp.]